MEIHNLNRFAGALGANVFLPVDNGSDTGKLSFADLFGGGSIEALWEGAITTGSAALSDAITNYDAVIIHYEDVVVGVKKTLELPVSAITIGGLNSDFKISVDGVDPGDMTVYIYMSLIRFSDAQTLSFTTRYAFTWDGNNAPDIEQATYATMKITRIDGIRMPANQQGVVLLKTVTVEAANWVGSTNTVTVQDVTASSSVLVCPIPSDQTSALGFGVYCSGQGADELTFTCVTTPTVDIQYNVMVVG